MCAGVQVASVERPLAQGQIWMVLWDRFGERLCLLRDTEHFDVWRVERGYATHPTSPTALAAAAGAAAGGGAGALDQSMPRFTFEGSINPEPVRREC